MFKSINTKQLKAELITNVNSDLSVANIARVSFNKWKTEYDESDKRLINYLAKHKHISPFFHQRFTFAFDYRMNYNGKFTEKLLASDKLTMGLSFAAVKDEYIIQHSFYGWVSLIKSKLLGKYAKDVAQTLSYFMPDSAKAYGIYEDPAISMLYLPDDQAAEINDSFINMTIRIEAPIPIMRQYFTHRRFATNEMSRRYVTEDTKMYIPVCWRAKPEDSIKQGSSTECIDIIDEKNKFSVDTVYATDVVHPLMMVYNKMIDSGVAPEMARFVLPQSMMTKAIFTGSVAAWKDLIELRIDSHAQLESQYIAHLIKNILEENGYV